MVESQAVVQKSSTVLYQRNKTEINPFRGHQIINRSPTKSRSMADLVDLSSPTSIPQNQKLNLHHRSVINLLNNSNYGAESRTPKTKKICSEGNLSEIQLAENSNSLEQWFPNYFGRGTPKFVANSRGTLNIF